MGHDDLKTPVQPASSQDIRGQTRLVANRAAHQSTSQTFTYSNDVFLTGTGQEISHRSFQNAAPAVHNQKHAVRQALSSDKRWTGHSENYLPIPASKGGLTMSEQDVLFVQSLSNSTSMNTLPVVSTSHGAMPQTSTTTVLESPMVPFTPSFDGVVPGTQVQNQSQPKAESNSEPASLEQLMNEEDDSFAFDCSDGVALSMDAGASYPQFNECPTGNGGGSQNGAGGSQAESGSGGQGHCVTGYSHQNYGPSMVTGGGGGLGGSGNGGDDDPFQNNRPLQRDHYSDGNVLIGSDDEDILRIIDEQLEHFDGQNTFLPTLETSEIFAEMDHLPAGIAAATPGDNMMAYYSKFETPGNVGLQPMEESTTTAKSLDTATPLPQQPTTPHQAPVPAAASVVPNSYKPIIAPPVSDSIGSSFDMIKMMKTQKKTPPRPVAVNCRPTDLSFPPGPPSPAGSYMSAPSPAVPPTTPAPSTPQLPHPVQVSTPQRQEQEETFSSLQQPQPRRAPSMPPPSPASPPTPVNVRPFDCQHYEEGGKIHLEMVVRKDLPEEDRRMTLAAFFHSVQFCMDLDQLMQNPCDLKVSYHICAKVCEYRFDSEENKLVFSVPSDCKHVSQWLSEKGEAASFLDRHAVLQQVLNAMATIHNGGIDKSLWGCFQVFVAPDSRVYIVPDIVPMLCKMHTTLGAPGFNPRTLDIEAIHQLFTLLIPPTINQNRSWISPGVRRLLESFINLVSIPSSIFKMAEIARTLGEKNMCRMDIDYLGMDRLSVFCVEHELVLSALTSIQEMIPDDTTIMWLPTFQPVAVQDLATAVRPMRLGVTYTYTGKPGF